MVTTNKLLETVRTKAALTAGQAGLDNSAILDLATDIMNTELVPMVKSTYEGYFLFTETFPLRPNEDYYRIPDRAMGNTLNHIYLECSDGANRDLAKYSNVEIATLTNQKSNRPYGFMIENSYVRVVPSLNANPSDALVMTYNFRPNKLVQESSARKVVAVEGNTITVSSIPVAWEQTGKLDVISHRSGNEMVAYSLQPTLFTNNVITLDQSVDDLGIEVGNWICREGESPVPMIPEDLHVLLIEMVVMRVAEIRLDDARKQNAAARIKTLQENLLQLVDDRVSSKRDIIKGRNPLLVRRRY